MGAPIKAVEGLHEHVAEIFAGRGANQVTARCSAVGVPPRRRYEICLQAGSHRAVVDVPRGMDPHALLHRAAELFAESLDHRR
jgi:hypothetical protein